MRALITGASGYIGRNLVHSLIEKGWSVSAIVRPTSRCVERIANYVYDGSISSLEIAVSKAKPDVVFHLAAHAVVEHKRSDIEKLLASNVVFGTHLLEAMAGSACFINTGTFSQFFDGQDSYNPANLYDATKQAFEDILRYYIERGLRATTLRLFDVYGPSDERPKLINQLYQASITGKRINLSPGQQTLYFVYISDVLAAYARAAELLLNGDCEESYVVRSGRSFVLREAIALYEGILGRTLPVIWGGKSYRAREIMTATPYGKPLPGWEAEVGLEEGLRRVIEWQRSR
jgi:nucleoside-diphosphate-sugar epimerase